VEQLFHNTEVEVKPKDPQSQISIHFQS
jgi:hypothetical protein